MSAEEAQIPCFIPVLSCLDALPSGAFSSIMQPESAIPVCSTCDSSMQVEVKLFSRFRQALPRETRGETTIDLPEGATLATLLDHLDLSGRVKLVTIEGQPVEDREQILSEGNRVYIFPVVVGG